MAFLPKGSVECGKTELDLFSTPPTQTEIENSHWIPHHPLSSITDTGPIEFNISGTGEDYLDLANTYLYIKAKITKADGSDLAADENVAFVNDPIDALFTQVDLSLNEKLVTQSTNTYPQRCYIEKLLGHGSDAKTSQLTAGLWFKDTAGKFDSTADGENKGYAERKKLTAQSKPVEMIGKIHGDLFHQERYILNGVNIKLRLVRSKNEFVLLSNGTGYKVVILDACLIVRKCQLSRRVTLAHAKALEKTTAKYPVQRVETKVFTIPKGNLNATQENFFMGQMPHRLIIGIVDTDAFNGSYQKSPFNFKHHNLTFCAVTFNGQQIPSKPLQPNYSETEGCQYTECYQTLFNGTGLVNRDAGNTISLTEYPKGYTLYAFDLTPDLCDGEHFNLRKQGNLRLELHFASALANTVNVIAYAEFENTIEIDKSRNIIFDYAC